MKIMQLYLFIVSLIKKYIKNYSGISNSCWEGITLSFIESTLMGVFYFLSVYFVSTLHLSILTASKIISCYGIGAILGGYIGGKLSDKITPRKVSVYSLLVQAIGYFILVKVTNPDLLMVTVFTLGVAAYGFITSNHLSVLDLCKTDETQKIKVINLLSTASNLGLGISGIYIGFMSRYGFKNIFFVTAVLILILSIYLLVNQASIKKEKKPKFHYDKKELHEYPINTKNNMNIIWLVLLSVLFVGSVVAQLSSTYSVFIEDSFPQMGINAVSILFTLNSLLVVVLATPIGNYFKNKNKIITLGFGGFLIGFGMFILSFSYIFIVAVISCIIYTLGEIIFFCMAQFICYQKGNVGSKGQTLGMFRMTYATSRVIGPFAGGHLYHYAGGHLIWYLSGIIGLLCLISCNKFKSSF